MSFEKEKKRKVSVRNFLIRADSEVVTNDKESGHEAMKKSSLAPMKISLHLRRELDTTHEFVHQNWASGVSKLCGGLWVTEKSPERKMNERHAITMTAAGFVSPQTFLFNSPCNLSAELSLCKKFGVKIIIVTTSPCSSQTAVSTFCQRGNVFTNDIPPSGSVLPVLNSECDTGK